MLFRAYRTLAGALSAAALTALSAGGVQAQVFPGGGGVPGGGGGGGLPGRAGVGGQTTGAMKLLIKRRTVSGAVKSSDADKKYLVVASGEGKDAKEVLIDVGPSLIKAGNGSATFKDIQPGDKVRVYGEVMVQGGVRAMEITLPKERMTIPPPEKPKKVKGERLVVPGQEEREAEEQAKREAEKARKEAEKAEKEARRKQREAEKKQKEEAKKQPREEKQEEEKQDP